MNNRSVILVACALLAMLPTAAEAQNKPAGKKLYCWAENGVQVCGDTLPPSAVDRARTEINSTSGLRTGSVDRALTGEERAAAAQAAEEARLAADAEAARRRRDLAMIESYATEADLRRAYNERIVLNDESVKTLRMGIDNLRQSLLSLLRQAAETELQAQPVRKPLADRIVGQHTELVRLQAMLRKQLQDRAELGNDLDQALQRYREMKTPSQG
ncbi:hypothetical protein [Luteimonas vadosa]|uniref:DUF4124 domain-containing protein n=1 Tax=Luteimonas vadosa TaxID=1165507 RepID=A0ABP9DVY8_9GAMM